MRVVTDKRLSPGARLLYVLLDDYAGIKGHAWPRQATLADRLGCSLRRVQQWLDELAAVGHITRERLRSGNRYSTPWDMQPAACSDGLGGGAGETDCIPNVQPAACASILQPVLEEPDPQSACPFCHNTGINTRHWPAYRDSRGRTIPERTESRPCGCQTQ